MSLKVCKNGTMYKINTNLHKPVVFLSGVKYKLDKAFTFINGTKKMLWGESGVQIDYISSTGVLGGGNIFAIGENWLDCYYNNTVYRINISNLSAPSLIQSVAWGNVSNFNGYQTGNGTNMIFTASSWTGNQSTLTGTTTANKMSLTPSTGAITVIKNDVYANYFLAQTTNNLVTTNWRRKTFTVGRGTVSIPYGTDFYWNGVLRYSTGREPSSSTDRTGFLSVDSSNPLQIGADTIVFNLSGDYGAGSGLYVGTPSTYYKLTDTKSGRKMYDNNVVVREYYIGSTSYGLATPPNTAISLVDPSSFATLYTYHTSFDITNAIMKVLGRIGDYYYIITMPNDDNATSGVRLILLNKANLTEAYTKNLPSDPFNENGGKITFWKNGTNVLQVSKTGYIGIGTYDATTLKLRIARFSVVF